MAEVDVISSAETGSHHEVSPTDPGVLAQIVTFSSSDVLSEPILDNEAAAQVTKTLSRVALPQRTIDTLAHISVNAPELADELSDLSTNDLLALNQARHLVEVETDTAQSTNNSIIQRIRDGMKMATAHLPDSWFNQRKGKEEQSTNIESVLTLRAMVQTALDEVGTALALNGENVVIKLKLSRAAFLPLMVLAALREKVPIFNTFQELSGTLFWPVRSGLHFINRRGEVPFGQEVLDAASLSELSSHLEEVAVSRADRQEDSRWKQQEVTAQQASLLFFKLREYAQRADHFKIDTSEIRVRLWSGRQFTDISVPLSDLLEGSPSAQQQSMNALRLVMRDFTQGSLSPETTQTIGENGWRVLSQLAAVNRKSLSSGVPSGIFDADVMVQLEGFRLDSTMRRSAQAKEKLLTGGSRCHEMLGFGLDESGSVETMVSAVAHSKWQGNENLMALKRCLKLATEQNPDWVQSTADKRYALDAVQAGRRELIDRWEASLTPEEVNASKVPMEFSVDRMISREKVEKWEKRIKTLKSWLKHLNLPNAELLSLNDLWPIVHMLRTGGNTVHSVAKKDVIYNGEETEVLDILTYLIPQSSEIRMNWDQIDTPVGLKGPLKTNDCANYISSLFLFLRQKREVSIEGKPSKTAVLSALTGYIKAIERVVEFVNRANQIMPGDSAVELVYKPEAGMVSTLYKKPQAAAESLQHEPETRQFLTAIFDNYRTVGARNLAISNGNNDALYMSYRATLDMVISEYLSQALLRRVDGVESPVLDGNVKKVREQLQKLLMGIPQNKLSSTEIMAALWKYPLLKLHFRTEQKWKEFCQEELAAIVQSGLDSQLSKYEQSMDNFLSLLELSAQSPTAVKYVKAFLDQHKT